MRAKNTGISSEDALIARIRELVDGQRVPPRVLNRIGDDAAVWQPSRSNRSIITADAMVEGVHFRRDLMTLYEAGYRAMAANISDAAASGARAVLATVSLGLPRDLAQEDALDVYRGLLACASAFGCAVAGGDCTTAPVIVLSISLVGEVRPSNVKGRAGARPGDIAAVTGDLGAARAGLLHARGDVTLEEPLRAAALRAFRTPQPRLSQGRWLAASANVHAMMDLSDGLSTDISRMSVRSGCGALIEQVPVAPPARAAAAAAGEDAAAFALAGGEDFELLVAVAPRAFRHLAGRYRARFGTDLTAVGTFRAGSTIALREAGGERPLAATGFDHFAG